jgi:TrmH family RNA methyltransferase
MGSAFRVPIVAGADLRAACREAHARGIGVAATSPSEGRDVYDTDLRPPLLVLVGGEGPGLADDLLVMAGLRVRIPMRAPCESLNVAMAAGIILFEARRQRGPRARP